MVGFKFTSPRVDLLSCHAQLPADVPKQLKIQLDEIGSRIIQVGQDGTSMPTLIDPGFEAPLAGGSNAAWTVSRWANGTASLDRQVRASGSSSLRLQAKQGTVRVTSNPFRIPETGRLVLSMKARSAAPTDKLGLVVLRSSGSRYTRGFELHNLSQEFKTVDIPFLGLPYDPDLEFRLSIESREGDLWVDDLTCSWFLPDDKKALKKILHSAFYQLEDAGDLTKCYETLHGYWPRFLLRHVPQIELAAVPPSVDGAEETIDKPNKPWLLQKWKNLVPGLRR